MRPVEQRTRLIAARFNGRCRQCGNAIAKGHPVWFAKHWGLKCKDCGPHVQGEPPVKKSGKQEADGADDTVGGQPKDNTSDGHASTGTPQSPAGIKVPKLVPDTGGKLRIHFDSLSEVVDTALNKVAFHGTNERMVNAWLEEVFSPGPYRDWIGGHTRESLLHALTNPPADLIEQIESLRRAIVSEVVPPPMRRRVVRRNLDAGDELDVDRWAARDPWGWSRSERMVQPRRHVSIGVNIVADKAQTREDLLYRGAAALALADHLTTQGVSVRIVAVCVRNHPAASTKVVRRSLETCLLKDGQMPLDIGSLAFGLCEIAFFRAIWLSAATRLLPAQTEKRGGHPAEVRPSEVAELSLDYLIDEDVRSREAAVRWLTANIERTTHAA